MKAFFRFLRGELNGFYLQRLNHVNNLFSDSIKTFLSHFSSMQFKTEDELNKGETAIDNSMIKGIGVIAGAFPPYVMQESLTSALRFTGSHIVNGKEYSERGLYNIEGQAFNFVRTDNQEYNTDINSLATSEQRSSLVEAERTPVGYFPEGESIIRDDGTLDYSKLMLQPRPNHADAPFYGDIFLYLSENYPVLAITDMKIMLYVIEAMQWVRYNGMNVASLAQFAKIICPDFLFIVDIDWSAFYAHGVVEYGIDEEYEAENKLLKENLFKTLVQKKFSQLTFSQVQINVTRDENNKAILVERR
jgi:hypothetical protein